MSTDVQEPAVAEAQAPQRNVAIKSIKLTNLLSFGPDTAALELRPLNILIGANGSGKSNFIRAISLLQAAPTDLMMPFVHSHAGVHRWIWAFKGDARKNDAMPDIEVLLPTHASNERKEYEAIRYNLSFLFSTESDRTKVQILKESVESPGLGRGGGRNLVYCSRTGNRVTIGSSSNGSSNGSTYTIGPTESVLANYKGPAYPQISAVGQLFSAFRIYRDWNFGEDAKVRNLNPFSTGIDFLEEDASNLASMVVSMKQDRTLGAELILRIKEFYADADDLGWIPYGDRFELFLKEKGFDTPATLLSDGTLRWLALLTILLHPTPPPLICLEEPELGLHPDIVVPLAELLREASQHTQLIITTHSADLVDAFTNTPDVVVVCEKEAGATKMRRLPNRDELGAWLDKFSLGEMWSMNLLGGNRY